MKIWNFHTHGVFDIIIASIYNKFDFIGVYIYTVVMALAIIIALGIVIKKYSQNTKIAIIFSLAIMYLATYVFFARAQQISFLIFILEFFIMHKLLETNKKRYGVLLLILPIILANFHSSVYPVYFVFYLPHFAEYILSKFNFKFKRIKIEKKENIKTLFIIFIISLFTGLCSTAGTAPYTDMIKVIAGVSTDFIGEHQTSNWYNNKIFYIILGLITVISIFGRQEMKITDIFYILGFSLMTIVTYRCVYFFWFIASIPIAKIFADFITANNIKIENKNIERIFFICLIILYIVLVVVSFLREQGREFVEDFLYPVEASEYIIKNLDIDNIRIYNNFNWGSYLEFKGIKAFIDSRSGMFCDEFNPGVTILEDWIKLDNNKVEYNEIFEKYEITHVLLEERNYLNEELSDDKLWNLIYNDEHFYFYEKIEV